MSLKAPHNLLSHLHFYFWENDYLRSSPKIAILLRRYRAYFRILSWYEFNFVLKIVRKVYANFLRTRLWQGWIIQGKILFSPWLPACFREKEFRAVGWCIFPLTSVSLIPSRKLIINFHTICCPLLDAKATLPWRVLRVSYLTGYLTTPLCSFHLWIISNCYIMASWCFEVLVVLHLKTEQSVKM